MKLFNIMENLENQDTIPEETNSRPDMADYRRHVKQAMLAAAKDMDAAKGSPCEKAAVAAYEALKAELADIDAEIKASITTEKPVVEKEAVEPIGKPTNSAVNKAVENKDKEVAPMKDVTNTNRLASVLRQAKLPKNVIENVINKFSVTDLRPIVFAEAKDALLVVEGVGEKRAEVIINVLRGRIPEPLAISKLSAEMREQMKAEIREKAKGFSCRTYAAEELWREVLPLIKEIGEFKPDSEIVKLKKALRYEEDDTKAAKMKAELVTREAAEAEKLAEVKAKFELLKSQIFTDKPLTVRRSEGRNIRLTRSMISDILGIDYESKRSVDDVAVLNHGVQELFAFSWRMFADNPEDGQIKLDEFQQKVMGQLGWYGVVAVSKDGSKAMFTPIGASASYQKEDKVLLAKTRLVKEHEKLFWFGKTMEEFVYTVKITGAEFWKARANMLRPWMKPFELENGRVLKVWRLLVVKDVEKLYKIINARIIGKANGQMYKDGPAEYKAIVGDGGILSIRKLKFQGQCSGVLFKGFFADGSSSLEAVCKKYGISLDEILDTMIEGIDGQMHRLGDFDAICGEGCWKGDKVFSSYTEYLDWLKDAADEYEGIDNLYLLRQAEEIEDEEKVRTLTRTLIQQFMWMSPSEIRELTKKARKTLKKGKTFTGAVATLAALWKTEEERTEVEKLFQECPWLIMSPIIQDYLQESWTRKKITAMSGKFRTEGQYPYIMQDPVALFEIWVLGKDPDDPTLGILKEGEVSCADVAEGRELLCVRFPANFLTAMVKKNKACKAEFSSLNGVMVLSVHDLILIAQDGDVDGDEMCVIYNRLAIRLVKRMQKEFDPPIILFAHGGKAEKKIAGSKRAFVTEMMTALWRAKRFDSVGIYANLAMKCAYLSSIALKNGDKKMSDRYLLWMSAASTGAILAIDQVKGNAVDDDLIKWLDQIRLDVNKAMKNTAKRNGFEEEEAKKMINPFVQFFVAAAKRKPIGMNECLPANKDNFLDDMVEFIGRDVGEWADFNSEGVVWNSIAAEEALTNGLPRMTVPYSKVTKEMVDLLGDNWFKLRAVTPEQIAQDKTKETLRKMVPGTVIGMKEFVELLWRNEASMANVMEGRQLWEKKEEYIGVCRELLRMLVENADWSKAKTLTKDDHWNVLVNALVRTALELNLPTKKDGTPTTNGIDKKGSFAIFVLKLIAPELRMNAKKNRVDQARFFGVTMDIEALVLDDIDQEKIEDDEELFESTPEQVVETEEDEEIPEEVLREWLEEEAMRDGVA